MSVTRVGRAAGADRVPQGDCAAVDIQPIGIKVQGADVLNDLRRECFVDLEQVVMVEGGRGLRQQATDSINRRGEDFAWRDCRLRHAGQPRQRAHAEFGSTSGAGDDQRSRAVGQSGGVASGSRFHPARRQASACSGWATVTPRRGRFGQLVRCRRFAT